jgi:hypothetical protein
MPIMVKRQRWRARSRITLGGKREGSGALDTHLCNDSQAYIHVQVD